MNIMYLGLKKYMNDTDIHELYMSLLALLYPVHAAPMKKCILSPRPAFLGRFPVNSVIYDKLGLGQMMLNHPDRAKHSAALFARFEKPNIDTNYTYTGSIAEYVIYQYIFQLGFSLSTPDITDLHMLSHNMLLLCILHRKTIHTMLDAEIRRISSQYSHWLSRLQIEAKHVTTIHEAQAALDAMCFAAVTGTSHLIQKCIDRITVSPCELKRWDILPLAAFRRFAMDCNRLDPPVYAVHGFAGFVPSNSTIGFTSTKGDIWAQTARCPIRRHRDSGSHGCPAMKLSLLIARGLNESIE